jgi:hypothetical protein
MGRSGVKASTVSVSYRRADDLNDVTRERAAAEIDELAAAEPWRAFRWCGAESLFRYVLECGPPGVGGPRDPPSSRGHRGFVVGAGDGVALGPCTSAPIVYTWSGERAVVIAVASGVLGSLPW